MIGNFKKHVFEHEVYNHLMGKTTSLSISSAGLLIHVCMAIFVTLFADKFGFFKLLICSVFLSLFNMLLLSFLPLTVKDLKRPDISMHPCHAPLFEVIQG